MGTASNSAEKRARKRSTQIISKAEIICIYLAMKGVEIRYPRVNPVWRRILRTYLSTRISAREKMYRE